MTDVTIRATVVLGTSYTDCVMRDGHIITHTVCPVYNCIKSYTLQRFPDVDFYQTEDFRKQKKVVGTEAFEVWSDLVRRRVIPSDGTLQFASINGIMIPCIDILLDDFNEATCAAPPYKFSFTFTTLTTTERKGSIHKIFHGVELTNLEGI